MPCYHPLKGFMSQELTKNGKRTIVFNPSYGFVDRPMEVPCGQCIGCRLERSRQWAIRCVHEASLHDRSCFITLTYDDLHLPPGGTLVMKHYQDFMKRLRKRLGFPIRFFHCGEYGDINQRPHYHALIFGFDFPDKKLYKRNSRGDPVFESLFLNEVWGKGLCAVGNLTFESAAYCARYIVKKVNGDRAEDHYRSVDLSTGEVINRIPEYITMSRRPGIGSGWYDKFKSDVFPDDFVVLRGKTMKPPKFYDRILEKEDLPTFVDIKRDRMKTAFKNADNNTPDRLRVREEVRLAQVSTLKRDL